MSMKTYKLEVSFTTPAFLGGADQSGRWTHVGKLSTMGLGRCAVEVIEG
jgi:hypothetical protein